MVCLLLLSLYSPEKKKLAHSFKPGVGEWGGSGGSVVEPLASLPEA